MTAPLRQRLDRLAKTAAALACDLAGSHEERLVRVDFHPHDGTVSVQLTAAGMEALWGDPVGLSGLDFAGEKGAVRVSCRYRDADGDTASVWCWADEVPLWVRERIEVEVAS